jgi:hypothetical protein
MDTKDLQQRRITANSAHPEASEGRENDIDDLLNAAEELEDQHSNESEKRNSREASVRAESSKHASKGTKSASNMRLDFINERKKGASPFDCTFV